MKTINVIQGSEEWKKAKCGTPSASNFDKIVTIDGKPSKQRVKYLHQLAGETITGKAEETYQNGVMQRGIETEAEARQLYELVSGNKVQEVGFCLADGYGASPDGLVGKKGVLEIKCPTLAVHVGYLLENVLPTDYFQQTQGQLLVTDREWVDFMSYFPGIKPLITRVKRDKKFIKILEVELKKLCVELKQIVRRIE